MPVVPSLLLWLALAPVVEPGAGGGSGYRPSGSLDELVDLGLLSRLRDPRIRPIGLDAQRKVRRDGGTFGGGAGCPGADSGLVVADFTGPGIVQRIWLSDRPEKPGHPDGAQDRLRIHLDGRQQPALDLALEDLATGRHRHFPRPLAGRAAGGVFSYVPIAFRSGCRIVLDGPHACLDRARVSAIALPDAAGLTPFQEEPSPVERAQLEKAVAAWSKSEDLVAPDRVATETSEYVVDGIARSTHRFLMPAGPRTIRALEIEVAPGTGEAWRTARLQFLWEDADAGAGVDLPVGFAFARLPDAEPLQSLLMGQSGSTWSNRFPMPYRRQAFLQIDAEAAIRGTIRVRTVPGTAPDDGYFRAAYREVPVKSPPVQPGGFELAGRGHYAGTLLAARGLAEVPRRPQGFGRSGGEFRWLIPGLGPELIIAANSSRPAGWEMSPAVGLFRGPGDPTPQPVAAYRWHAADPLPFDRPLCPTIELDNVHAPGADCRAALAVFWYSERPGS
jgi:hypothetical protein